MENHPHNRIHPSRPVTCRRRSNAPVNALSSSCTNLCCAADAAKDKQGREVLMAYLAEMGFTDNVIHAQVRVAFDII